MMMPLAASSISGVQFLERSWGSKGGRTYKSNDTQVSLCDYGSKPVNPAPFSVLFH
jgi:hypothetical protein